MKTANSFGNFDSQLCSLINIFFTPELHSFSTNVQQLSSMINEMIRDINSLKMSPIGDIHLKELLSQKDQLLSLISQLYDQFYDAETAFVVARGDEVGIFSETSELNPYRNIRGYTLNIRNAVYEFQNELEHILHLLSSSIIILDGEAGIGKTHLLCDIAQNRIKQRKPSSLP